MGVTPHVAQNQGRRRSRLDQRTTRHPGYEISQRKRKRIEEVFGWMKTVGMLRQLRHRGLERVGWVFTVRLAASFSAARDSLGVPRRELLRHGSSRLHANPVQVFMRPVLVSQGRHKQLRWLKRLVGPRGRFSNFSPNRRWF